jgi:hypothetical protein
VDSQLDGWWGECDDCNCILKSYGYHSLYGDPPYRDGKRIYIYFFFCWGKKQILSSYTKTSFYLVLLMSKIYNITQNQI